MMGELG